MHPDTGPDTDPDTAFSHAAAETSPIAFDEISDLLPTGYLLFDRSSVLRQINRSAESVLGLQRVQVVGRHLKEVFAAHPSLPVLFQRSLLVQQMFTADIDIGEQSIEVTYQPLFHDDRQRTYRGSLVTLHDVTARRESARALGAVAQRLRTERDDETERLETLLSRLVESLESTSNPDCVADRANQLTPRETEVLELAGSGMTSQAIADQLGLSRRTVDVHRASIRRKTGLQSRADWRAYAEHDPSLTAVDG